MYIPFQITKVESQVVAGVKYTVTLILATTNCKKGIEPEKLEICEENTGKYDISEWHIFINVLNIFNLFFNDPTNF